MKISKLYEFDINCVSLNIIVYKYEKNNFKIVDMNDKALFTEKLTKEEVIGEYITEIFPRVKELVFLMFYVECMKQAIKRFLVLHFTVMNVFQVFEKMK